jgi:hypothetical protein
MSDVVKKLMRPWLAWVVFGLVAALLLGSMLLSILNSSAQSSFFGLLMFPFPAVGVVIASRHARNPIGWILLAIGFVWELTAAAEAYATYGLVTHPGALPAPELSAALSVSLWVPGVGLMGTFLILLFPDGRLPSPRWRPWGLFCALALVVVFLVITFAPGPIGEPPFEELENPLGIESLRPLVGVLTASILLIPLAIVGCAFSLIQRFRRSGGRERLQLKWLAAAAGACAAIALVSVVVTFSTSWNTSWFGADTPLWIRILHYAALYSFVLIPVAVGMAILRHRLYDIDRIINKTIVYGVVTAVLAAGYAAAILGLQALLPALTRDSAPAVAASTLAMVALFRPLRNRVQSFVDRRFYRRRYDAARTIESFGSRLRQETDLDSLRRELLGLVEQTMQPSSVSLWLRRLD